MREKKLRSLALLWLASLTVLPMESRHVGGGSSERNDAADEEPGVDLEEVLGDYYDNLVEAWSRDGEPEANGEREGSEGGGAKLKREQEKGAPGGPPAPDNATKSYLDMAIPIKIGNITYRYLNESYAAILDLQRASRERVSNDDGSARKKEMRLSSIKDSVLSLRGGNSTGIRVFPSSQQTKTIRDMFERHVKSGSESPVSNMFAEKSQSFYPSCDLPKNTDEALWSDPYSMNLLFDIYFPTPQRGTILMVVDAVLRLYTISQANFTLPLEGDIIPGIKIQVDDSSVNVPNFGRFNAEDEKQIRISVYWYTRALRRHRVKKKLLDSRMMPLYGDHNLTFNIRAAVRSWKESGKNFGLLVTVEDEDGTLLKASHYIRPMNCSKWAATVRPLPLFGFDSPTQYFIEDGASFEDRNGTLNETNYDDEGSQFVNDPAKYPILGLRMREVSHSVMRNLALLNSAIMELDHQLFNGTRRRPQPPGAPYQKARRPDAKKAADPKPRVTFFENVPLGFPIGPGASPAPSANEPAEDAAGKTEPEDGEGKAQRIRHGRKQAEVRLVVADRR